MRFSTSSARCKILEGLLDYRQAMHRIGLVSGFQWLDGSFLEDVETIEKREPRDIDVVTFFHTPNPLSITDAEALLFDPATTKRRLSNWIPSRHVNECPGLLIGTACGRTDATKPGKDFCK